MGAPRVVLLAGKPPREGTILADVAAGLTDDGCRVDVLLPHEQTITPSDLRADLVVHRGLRPAVWGLLAEAERGRVPVCPPAAAVARLASRSDTWEAVSAGGVPVPRVERAATWPDVLALAEGGVVVKSERGSGRGREVAASPLPDAPPFDGPYLVEEFVPNDGVDRKLYVAGETVLGLAKPSTLDAAHGQGSAPLAVDDELRAVGLGAARATGLHLLGVDVVLGPRGPVVVDVNVFPGYRGVAGAAAAVVEHLLSHLR